MVGQGKGDLTTEATGEDRMDAITGHETGGSTGRRVYTHLDMEDLQQAVEQLSYDSVDTSPRMDKPCQLREPEEEIKVIVLEEPPGP